MILLRRTAWFVALLAVLLSWARVHASLMDDAYISFRYARNLLEGNGLVYNVGEYVEGYTNLGWVLLVTSVWAVTGWDPTQTHWVLSGLQTVALAAVIVAIAWRSPRVAWREPIAFFALLLWCTNRSVSVWTTSGLEMRQFSLLATLAVFLMADGRSRAWLVAGSFAWAAAELTRPEALMFAPLAIGTWALHRLLARRLALRDLVAVAAPFGTIVVAHFLWRFATYGEWLPNTYYAKAVRPWWDMGADFWALVTLEHGLYLLVPFAVVGAASRWSRGDASVAMGMSWMLPQVLHVAKIGGDHFEFRMLDPFWPILVVGASEGVASLLDGVRARWSGPEGGVLGGASGFAAALALVVSGLVLPLVHDRLAFEASGDRYRAAMVVKATRQNAPILTSWPPFSWMVEPWNDLNARTVEQFVAIRAREHQLYGRVVVDRFSRYGDFDVAGMLPDDALVVEGNIGAFGWYLRDVSILDKLGLTDAVVARAPVGRENEDRRMAHDRRPPAGYLKRRGANMRIFAVRSTARSALATAPFALELAPTVWLPFHSGAPSWVADHFEGQPLHTVAEIPALAFDRASDPGDEVRSVIEDHGHAWRVTWWLGQFEEDSVLPWAVEGRAFPSKPVHGAWSGQSRVRHYEGASLLNSYHPAYLDALQGSVVSPVIQARPGVALTFLVGGGKGHDTAVVLRSGGEELGRWHGRNRDLLHREVVPLDPWVGKPLQVSVEDRSSGAWGHIVADGFALVRRATPAEVAAARR